MLTTENQILIYGLFALHCQKLHYRTVSFQYFINLFNYTFIFI